MKHWADPNQRPLVRSVLFEEVGSGPRAPSPFFEGRSPASYKENPAHHGSNGAHDGADPQGAFGDERGAESFDDAYADDDSAAFDPIVPAEELASPFGLNGHVAHAPIEPQDDARVHAAIAQLHASIEDLVSARAQALAGAEHDVIRLAVALAERIVGTEIRQRPELLLKAARDGIQVLAESDRYVVRVATGPSDAHLDALRADLVARFPRSEVIVDPALPPFSCIVESEQGRVDESIAARMTAVLEQAGLTKVTGSP